MDQYEQEEEEILRRLDASEITNAQALRPGLREIHRKYIEAAYEAAQIAAGWRQAKKDTYAR